MKKLISIIIAAAIGLTAAITVVGCDANSVSSGNNDATNPVTVKLDSKQTMVFGVASAAMYLDNLDATTISNESSFMSFVNTNGNGNGDGNGNGGSGNGKNRPEEITDDTAAKLNEFISMFEGFLIDESIPEQVTQPTEEDGEYSTYQYKITISLPTADGSKDEMALYYNETAEINGGEEAEENDEEDDDDKDDKDEQDEEESCFTVEGVLIKGEDVYEISGGKETETEDGEMESELYFTTKSKLNPDNYITIIQEIEVDEVFYQYTVFNNKRMVSQTKICLENDEEDGLEMKINFKNMTDGSYGKITFAIEVSDVEGYLFEIKYKANNNTSKILVSINEDGDYVYEYANGYCEAKDRIRSHKQQNQSTSCLI